MRAPIKTQEEFEAVMAYTDTMERPQMYRFMLLLSIKLGLRPLEIAGLDSSWFIGDELRIPLGHSKRKSGRSLPINDEIEQGLRAHMGSRKGRVFLNANGEAFAANGISEAIRRIYRLSGVSGSCYSGRRSMATRMVDGGENILVVQRALGHASPVTTMNYVGITDSMLRRAMFA